MHSIPCASPVDLSTLRLKPTAVPKPSSRNRQRSEELVLSVKKQKLLNISPTSPNISPNDGLPVVRRAEGVRRGEEKMGVGGGGVDFAVSARNS